MSRPTMSDLSLHASERQPALILHLSPLVNLILPFIGGILGPVCAWLAFRDQSVRLDREGRESVNFQLSLLLYGIILTCLALLAFTFSIFYLTQENNTDNSLALMLTSFWGVYLPCLLLYWIIPLIFMILAVLNVTRGKGYRYPLNIRWF